jgi:hypothetical protein
MGAIYQGMVKNRQDENTVLKVYEWNHGISKNSRDVY